MRGHGRRGGNAGSVFGRHLPQQLVPSQAGIPRAALRVQDPKLRRPPRRPVPIPRDAHLGPLPYDVPAEAYPRPPAQLQAERGNLGQRAHQRRGQTRRLEHQQLDPGSTRQRRQAVQSLAQSGRGQTQAIARQRRQVQQQQVHRSVLEEHRRHRQRLLDGVRREYDQPFELNAPSRRFDRVEAPREVQVGGYPTGGLDLGDGPQPESGLAARSGPLEGRDRGTRQSPQAEDGIQSAKAGGYRPLVRDDRRNRRFFVRDGPRRHRQRPQDLPAPARSCPSPAIPEGLESSLDVGRMGGHGTSIIEHTFT